MKNALLVTVLLLPFYTFSQSDSTVSDSQFRWGTAVSFPVHPTRNAMYLLPAITYSNKNHQFELGTSAYLWKQSSERNRYGGNFNYRYYPNTQNTRFSSFLFLNALFNYRINERSYESYYYPNQTFYRIDERINYSEFATHFGYGIQIKLWKGSYFISDVSAGTGYFKNVENRTTNHPVFANNGTYSDWDLSFRASLGVGWRF